MAGRVGALFADAEQPLPFGGTKGFGGHRALRLYPRKSLR